MEAGKEVDAVKSGNWENFRAARNADRDKWFADLPSKPTWEKEEYMENQTFIMPLLEDGVLAVGELYNIRQAKLVGANLIHYDKLTPDYLVAHPRKDLEYRFDYISDRMDFLDKLYVSASIKIDLELSGGTVKVNITGHAVYDSVEEKKFWEDEIKCTYRMETYSIQLQSSALMGPKNIVNQDVYNLIDAGKMDATHICTEVILGGETIINFFTQTDETKHVVDVLGELTIKVDIKEGMVKVDASASLTMEKKDKTEKLDYRIFVYAKPPLKGQPYTAEDMIKNIRNIPVAISEEKHFPMFKQPDYSEVTGVPIRYKLTPLENVIEFKNGALRKSFRVIDPALIQEFLAMLATLKDFQSLEFMKRKIYEREPRTLTMLQDHENPITKRITARETELASKSKEIQNEANIVYQNYKEDEANADPQTLIDVIIMFNQEFDVVSVYQEIEEYRREAKREIVGIRMTDTENADEDIPVVFMSNETELEEWYGSEKRMKILLHTSYKEGQSPAGTFIRLYNMSKLLQSLGADVGIAYPSISQGFKLCIKANGAETVYQAVDIPFALEILGLAIGKVEKVPRTFWTVNGSLTGIQLPLKKENMSDIPSLIAINREFQDVKVCPTYLTLREEMGKKDGRVKIILEVQTLESIADSIVFLRKMRSDLEKVPAIVQVDWAVGTFDLGNFHDAPIAFAFFDGELIAVCLDNLDLLILLEQLRSETPNFEILSVGLLRYRCMYPNRGNFGLQVAQLLGQYHGSMTDRVEELSAFSELQMTPYEFLEKYKGLLDTIFVNREMVSSDELKVVSAVALICTRKYPQMLANLKMMGWTESSDSFSGGLLPSTWMDVSKYLQEFLETENPFLAKADYLRKKYLDILESYDTDTPADPKDALESISVIINHENPLCPSKLKEDLNKYLNTSSEMQVKGYAAVLSAFCEKEFSKDELFDLRHFMNFTEILREGDKIPGGIGTIIPEIMRLYIRRVLKDPVLEKYPGVGKQLQDYLEQSNYFQTLSLMSKIQYDHRLFMIQQWFYLLSEIDDTDNIKKLVNKMGKEEFSFKHYEDLWKNSKFAYYMLKGVNTQSVLEAIAMYQCSDDVVPDHMPVEFEEKLEQMLREEDDLVFEWQEDWETINDALEVFQLISVRKSIPKAFPDKLRENVEKAEEVREALKEADALYYWDDKIHIFTQPWDLQTIAKAIDKLMNYLEAPVQPNTVEVFQNSSEIVAENQNTAKNCLEEGENLAKSWKAMVEDTSSKMNIGKYNRLSEIQDIPVISHRELDTALTKILPYVIQRTKSLSPDVLSPSKVYNYVKYPQQLEANLPGVIDFGDPVEESKIPLLSRGDILMYLLNNCDPVVGHSIIQLLGKNPMFALPLIVQHLNTQDDKEKQFIVLFKQLENIGIKWEPIPGEIVQNNLFTNPFRLTVVVRLGENHSGFGKSQILNSIMAPPYIPNNYPFSSIKDSQSELERPISHPGFVELLWLTKETSKDTFYQKLFDTYYSKFYSSGSNEILLLGNLHGDAIEHHKIMIDLNRMGAIFLALVMPDTWENMKGKVAKLKSLVGIKDNIHCAFVDPIRGIIDEDRYSSASVITTREIVLGKTTILEKLLLKSFNSSPTPYLDNEEHVFTGLQTIETVESRNLILLVKKHTCRTVRQILKLHSLEQYVKSEFLQVWNNNADLQELISAFQKILRLPEENRESSFAHVKQQLSLLSSDSSMKIRKQAIQLISELKTSVEAEIPIWDEIRNLHNQVKALRMWIDDRTLGLEHFFREIGRCHEIEKFQDHMTDADYYADYILQGNEIEIFNRDAGDILWGKWLQDVFSHGMPTLKNSRIFVVSIIGLISSGKSSLLNALFGCKFSISIGGGTRGIFMKLLFLEDQLKERLKVDIIVLLDTQGISTIGGVGDEETLQKEQQLIALTVGLSNLTLLNTRGIHLGNMSNVLESVFAKLTCVEELAFVPDFILVHHQTEHRHMQTELAIADLTDALRAVSDVTEDNELYVGVRYRIGRRLNKIMRRVKHRDIVHQISPLTVAPNETSRPSQEHHESVMKLYAKILETCQESDKILTFGQWYEFSGQLWKDLTCHKDNFPLRFTNSATIQDFLALQKKIISVEELTDFAFASHTEGLKFQIGEIENEGIETFAQEDEEDLSPREKRRKFILNKIRKALRKMAGTCERALEDNIGPCKPCSAALVAKESLLGELKGSNYRFATQETLNDYIVNVRNSIWNRLNQSLMSWEMKEEPEDRVENREADKYKTLNVFYNEAIDKVFHSVDLPDRWKVIQQLMAPQSVVVPADTQIINEVAEYFVNLPHLVARIENSDGILPDLGKIMAFDLDYYNAIRVFELEIPENNEGDEVDCGCKSNQDQSPYLDWLQKDWLEAQLRDVSELMWQSRCYDSMKKEIKVVYEVGMMREFQTRVVKILDLFEERTKDKLLLLPNFKWEAHIYALVYYISFMKSKQKEWNDIHLPLLQIHEDLLIPSPEAEEKPDPDVPLS